MDRDIEAEYERHREDPDWGHAAELDQILAEHRKDDSGRCVLCGTLWPCLVWVSAREESDRDAGE